MVNSFLFFVLQPKQCFSITRWRWFKKKKNQLSSYKNSAQPDCTGSKKLIYSEDRFRPFFPFLYYLMIYKTFFPVLVTWPSSQANMIYGAAIISPILHMRKLRHGKAKSLGQDCITTLSRVRGRTLLCLHIPQLQAQWSWQSCGAAELNLATANLSNTAVTSHTWPSEFKFKRIKNKYNVKMKSFSHPSHISNIWCGQWLPYWTAQIEESFHYCRNSSWTRSFGHPHPALPDPNSQCQSGRSWVECSIRPTSIMLSSHPDSIPPIPYLT